MKTLKIGVLGARGRMGTEIMKLIDGEKSLSMAADEPGKKVDVWIDFSSPEGLDALLDEAVRKGIPVVSGTTGLDGKLKKKMKKASEKIPILWSSNMSFGVAVFREALRALAPLADFDFQIEEVHHRRKKDRPSGTALTLQETLEETIGRKCPEPLSIRGGGVFGIHKVWAMSEEEILTFEHQALNRAVFARGAVRAATWIVGRGPGLYAMSDLFADGRRSRRSR